MAQLFGISVEQFARICPLFPKERGVKPVGDRKVSGGIITCHSEGSAPGGYAPAHKTLYNHCRRWSDKGVFERRVNQGASTRRDGTFSPRLQSRVSWGRRWRPWGRGGVCPQPVRTRFSSRVLIPHFSEQIRDLGH